MDRRTTFAVFVLILGVVSVQSCEGTKLTGSWKDPAYASGPFKKVLVVGVSRQESLRRMFETNFTTHLERYHVEGIPSSSIWPGAEQLDRDSIEAKVAELGCDGVLVSRVLDHRTRSDYYPATGYVVPNAYHEGYYSYYYGSYTTLVNPAHTEESTTASVETNLYDVRTGKLVWSGLTELTVTEDPRTPAGELIDILVDELSRAKLIH